jgi:hypothetical protein
MERINPNYLGTYIDFHRSEAPKKDQEDDEYALVRVPPITRDDVNNFKTEKERKEWKIQ